MNWHSKNAWGGYTFDENLHPVPADLGDFARKASNLVTLVNLHDAGGVGAWEASYKAYCDAVGADCSAGKGLPANFTSRQALVALEDLVWKPVQEQFSDYAWIDWQQVRWALARRQADIADALSLWGPGWPSGAPSSCARRRHGASIPAAHPRKRLSRLCAALGTCTRRASKAAACPAAWPTRRFS